MNKKRWQSGETIMVRYPPEERMVRCYQVITGDPLVNVAGWPHVVLEDNDQRIALYLPEGTNLLRWNVAERALREPRVTQGDSIRLFFPDKPYEVSLFFETGTGPAPWVDFFFPGVEARFYGWKIDITSPFVRTDIGLDMIDETLDIMVTPDRKVRWKDEDQMAVFVDLGIYTAAEADALRAVGHDVIKMVQKHEPPFDDEWINWQPQREMRLGEIPEGWQFLPVPSPYKTYDLTEDSRRRIAAAARLRWVHCLEA